MMQPALWIERLRNRFWALPALGIACGVVAGILLPELDDHVALPPGLEFTAEADTARATLQMIATVAVSMAGISFSVIVVALVLASQQLSPRVLQNFQRHPLNQTVLGAFLGTAAFSLYVLSAVEGDTGEKVPESSVGVAMLLAGAALVLFIFFLHHLVRSLNASAVIRRIARDGHQAVDAPYPAGAGEEPTDADDAERAVERLTERHDSTPVTAPRAGYVASVEAPALIRAAEEADGFVEQEALIGEFVVTGAVLARVWCGDDRRDELVAEVEDGFVLNEERVVDDDIAFPLRQLADIALKGLSPSINDPTTAENAMDSVADTLGRVARQPLPAALRLSDSRVPRLRARRHELDDLVRMAFDQVRRDGAARPSFAVRLLELLADLRATGGPRAEACEEIDRQALLVCEHAATLADVGSDRTLVQEAYRRLHQSGRAHLLAVPAADV